MNKPVVSVFAKLWSHGAVKTRLAASIGEKDARDIYRRVAEQVWRQLESDEFDRWLWVADKENCKEAGEWLTGANKVLPQCAGDLGERMLHAFNQAIGDGAPWCAIVGSDAPAINATMLKETAATFGDGADLVIAPAIDGGYGLIAARNSYSELFTQIPWSTEQVLDCTLRKAEELSLNVSLLGKIRDIDTENDLNFFVEGCDGFFV